MKNFLRKLFYFVTNSLIVFHYRRLVLSRAKSKLKNPETFSQNYGNYANHSEFRLDFTDGFSLFCYPTDLSAVAETCVLEDYVPAQEFQVGPNMIIVDIGANIGDYTVWAANNGAKIIAVEPEVRNVARLKKNLEYNRLEDKVKIIPAAIFNYTGKIQLTFNPNSAGGHVTNKIDSSAPNDVQCFTLEDLLSQNNIAKVDILKIDVEGAEYDILSSVSAQTFSKIKRIVGEYHKGLDHKNNFFTLKKILERHYRVVKWYYPFYFYAHN